MAKWTGEPGGGGLFTAFDDQRFEFGNKKYGRWSPVLAEDGSVQLEAGETLLASVVADRVSESSAMGPDGSLGGKEIWSQSGAISVGITDRRVYFATDDLPINAIQQRVQRRHGTRHVGHFRYVWTSHLRLETMAFSLGLSGDEEAAAEVRGNHAGHFARTSLRVEIASSDVEFESVADQLLNAVLTDRTGPRGGGADRRAEVEAALTEARTSGAEVVIPGALPHPFMAVAEQHHPLVLAAEHKGGVVSALRDIEAPLRTVPLKSSEARRIRKAFGKWTSGPGEPRQVRRWMYDVDVDFLISIATRPGLSADVISVLKEHPDDRLRQALGDDPSAS